MIKDEVGEHLRCGLVPEQVNVQFKNLTFNSVTFFNKTTKNNSNISCYP